MPVSPRPELPAALRRTERGSTLLLFPTAVLIMVALAAMTVDSAIGFMAQRELVSATAAAANDVATLALSDTAFYEDDVIALSPSDVETRAIERVQQLLDDRHEDLVVTATATQVAGCAWTVTVTASSRVDELFGSAMPGSDGEVAVHASSVASPRQVPGGC
jgi:Flp pilus assembly protein TadG